MAKSTTVISLPQMVDLALNSPEVGIVNFTVLHSLLHVIVNQLDLGECNVEFRGSDSERLQNYISTAKPGPLITLTEYTVGPDGQSRTPKTKKGKAKEVSAQSGQKEKEIAILKQEDSSNAGVETERETQQTIVVVSKEKLDDIPKFAVAVTKDQFNRLSTDIKSLQEEIKELKELPGNIGLIDAIRQSGSSSTKSSPVLDMFQIMNLVKRLDATEGAMNKLASMMEDLAKEQAHQVLRGSLSSKQGGVSFSGAPKAPEDSIKTDNTEAAALSLLVKSQELRDSLGGAVPTDVSSRIAELDARLSEIEKVVKSLGEGSTLGTTSKKRGSGSTRLSSTRELEREDDAEPDGSDTVTEEVQDIALMNLSKMPSKDAIAILQRELINFKQFFMDSNVAAQALKEVEELKEAIMTGTDQAMSPDVKVGQIDLKLNELREQVNQLDTVYHQQFERIDNGIQHLEQEISAVWERINTGMPAGDATLGAESQNVSELYNKLLQLQENMNTMSDTATKLLSEREGRQNTLDMMIEQIELLKTVKADKEDLEDALADKADACQINRKVSHEQFDAAYDEISKALTEHLERLQKQEEMWEQGLNEIQKEISGKLDKMELIPLRDFINSKLKMVQDKVKKISAMKEEYEAAGTKSRFLRNVNCISCDADVVMKKQNDITMFPKPYAMPPSKNVGPYLAYELDQLRKQQKGLPNSKNLNMFENAMNQAKMKSGDKDHICNRYCGGSHTTTTPQQRVMRVGHFMEQWGPEIAPVKDVLIRGTDGHLYKGRDDNQLKALAAEKAPTPRVETPAMVISEVGASGGGAQRPEAGDSSSSKKDVHKPQSALVTSESKRGSLDNNRPRTSIERTQSKQSVSRSVGSGELKEIKPVAAKLSSDKAMPTVQKSQDMRSSLDKAAIKSEARLSLEKTSIGQATTGSAERPRTSLEQKQGSGAELVKKRSSQKSAEIKPPSNPALETTSEEPASAPPADD